MLSFLALILLASPATPQPPASNLTGYWVTADKSVVQVLPCAGAHTLCVRITAVEKPGAPTNDARNPDVELAKRPLCGLQIGSGFKPDGLDKASDGKLYDPESGKTYSGQMQEQGKVLKLRGYIGISLFGRTETWHHVTGSVPTCK